MIIKKFVILLMLFGLYSCATSNPQTYYTGYKSISDIPVKDKNSSKIYILHQPYEFPGLPIKALIYADDKFIGRTFPELILMHETNKPKVRLDVYGYYCTGDVKDYGSGKITLEVKPGEDTYVVVRETRTAIEVPTALIFAIAWCSSVESSKSAFHEFRKVSKEAWTEIVRTKSSGLDGAAGSYKYKDEDLKAAREYFSKEQINK
jgi:hypothetical protein